MSKKNLTLLLSFLVIIVLLLAVLLFIDKPLSKKGLSPSFKNNNFLSKEGFKGKVEKNLDSSNKINSEKGSVGEEFCIEAYSYVMIITNINLERFESETNLEPLINKYEKELEKLGKKNKVEADFKSIEKVCLPWISDENFMEKVAQKSKELYPDFSF